MVKSYFSRELLGLGMGARKTTKHKANQIRNKRYTHQFRIPKERDQLKTAYNIGRIERNSDLCISEKRRQREEIWEKKKKKNVLRKKSSSDGNTSFPDDILASEILTRLPSKSLMRFKSTCKRWLSLIQHDSHFHDSHFNHAATRPCQWILLLPTKMDITVHSYDGFQECSLSADLGQGRVSVDIVSRTKSLGGYNGILYPVNGLICFFNSDASIASICIYNLGTRKITPWICSTLVLDKENEVSRPIYGFGFDQTAKEHKVICVWRRELPTPHVACEILTVGHSKWRRVDDVQLPYEFDQESCVYVNGSIYWICGKFWFDKRYQQNFDPQVIIAFDVGSEKFRTISVPSVILNQHCDGLHAAGLIEVDGCVALFCRMDGYTVKMWTYFHDHHYDNNKNKNISTSDTNCFEETIKLPFCCDGKERRLVFHCVAGTDQLIIRRVSGWMVSFYSYNRKTRRSEKLEISGVSSIMDPIHSLFAPFLESLFPVSSNGTPTLTLDLKSNPVKELRGAFPFCTFKL